MTPENEKIIAKFFKTKYANEPENESKEQKVERMTKHLSLLNKRQLGLIVDGFQYKNHTVMNYIDHEIDHLTANANSIL